MLMFMLCRWRETGGACSSQFFALQPQWRSSGHQDLAGLCPGGFPWHHEDEEKATRLLSFPTKRMANVKAIPLISRQESTTR